MLAFPANNYRGNRWRMEATPKLGAYVFSESIPIHTGNIITLLLILIKIFSCKSLILLAEIFAVIFRAAKGFMNVHAALRHVNDTSGNVGAMVGCTLQVGQ